MSECKADKLSERVAKKIVKNSNRKNKHKRMISYYRCDICKSFHVTGSHTLKNNAYKRNKRRKRGYIGETK